MSNAERIRQLNDAFRTTRSGGRLFLTRGIAGRTDTAEILDKVSRFDDFCEDNDPYGEHDFGSFMQGADKIFWKIDYYDAELNCGSPDPADPKLTTRVLTVMLADEY